MPCSASASYRKPVERKAAITSAAILPFVFCRTWYTQHIQKEMKTRLLPVKQTMLRDAKNHLYRREDASSACRRRHRPRRQGGEDRAMRVVG
jgi:hypothetical protein